MESNELLTDLFGRVTEHVHEAVDDLDAAALTTAPSDGTNTIGWLVWHLIRVQDHHISELMEKDQLWMTGDWPQRFGVEADPDNTGYGHSDRQVAAIKPDSAAALIDYYDAAFARTKELIDSSTSADLDRVVDRRWDPPVTLGARLISIADDCIQHSGQAAYARGMLDRG
jgi:uncharacterized damage-inducible protein DinB